MALTKVTGSGIADAVNSAISANTAKVTNYNQTKADIEALGIDASSLTGSLPAISGANLTGIETVTKSATAPSSPAAGDMWFDTTTGTNTMKVWSGTNWDQMSNKFSATGGTESTYSSGGVNYKVHTFTSSGTFTVEYPGTVEYLVVAGGGSGGSRHGGGGGAGGMLTSSTSLSAQTYSIVVGAGGAASSSGESYNGNAGSNSTAFGSTAVGGGYGNGLSTLTAGSGGSGGGGRGSALNPGGSGTSGQGNSGGAGHSDGGGGGGGKGAAGSTPANSASGGNGGNGGNNNYYTGSNITYAGGGGGSGSQNITTRGIGGSGGGGQGSRVGADDATAGTINLGGGGGGGGHNNNTGANYSGKQGGSGIVIIRYVV